MRIASIKLALPARTVSNAEILDLVREHSVSEAGPNLDSILTTIDTLLNRSGAESRRWSGPDDAPLALIAAAVEQALAEADFGLDDIDLLIYAGIDRGYLEPANAYFVAHSLGLDRVHCFDVVDACNGWVRALQIIEAMFGIGTYRRAIVVNSEFPMFDGGAIYPRTFTMRNPKDIARAYAGLTLGEGVAVTLVEHDPNVEWQFRFASRNDLAGQCALPLPGNGRYTASAMAMESNEPLRFASNASRMIREGQAEISNLVLELPVDLNKVAAIFPHAATHRQWLDGAQALGVGPLLYSIFPRYGNLASASVPAGIATAIDEACIHRGQTVVCVTGSAGMSFAALSFTY